MSLCQDPWRRIQINRINNYEVRKVQKKKILITGAAGFIGFHLSKKLLEDDMVIIGFDNLNDYYDVNLKLNRLKNLEKYENFTFTKNDLIDNEAVVNIFKNYSPDVVVNLAAQAGVRHSIENPRTYVESNVNGFFNILEACRHYPVEQLLYASSSSIYGNQEKTPFSTSNNVDHPVSLYAATKKSNELMSHTYSYLYNVPTTGLRFFTVYGSYGRPDMAYFNFTKKILNGEILHIFNNGDMYRDFTYIDDVVQVINDMIINPIKRKDGEIPYKIYNIGNNQPEALAHFIETLEKIIGKEASKVFLPMQKGDVYQTYADISSLRNDFDFNPNTSIEEGLKKFVKWYKEYYKVT